MGDAFDESEAENDQRDNLTDDLRAVLNKHSAENLSGTPDFVLAGYLLACLDAYNAALHLRDRWLGK